MSLNIFWFIPTFGDNRYLGSKKESRISDYDYVKQVAIAADTLGFDGVLIPTGRSCEDPFVVASSLINVTQKLKFLVALRPGLLQPSLAARIASTLDRFSNGRVAFNLVAGGDKDELEGDGLFQDSDERYEAAAEFIDLWKDILKASYEKEVVNFDGKHYKTVNSKLLYPPVQRPHPPLFFGGSSQKAHELAAQKVDLYITWGETPQAVKEKIEDEFILSIRFKSLVQATYFTYTMTLFFVLFTYGLSFMSLISLLIFLHLILLNFFYYTKLFIYKKQFSYENED